MTPQIRTGDRVAIAAKFLRSIMDFTHESASKRGKVTDVLPIGARSLVTVHWDDGHMQKFLDCNLVLAFRIHLEPR